MKLFAGIFRVFWRHFRNDFFPRQPRIDYTFFISKAVFWFRLNIIVLRISTYVFLTVAYWLQSQAWWLAQRSYDEPIIWNQVIKSIKELVSQKRLENQVIKDLIFFSSCDKKKRSHSLDTHPQIGRFLGQLVARL